MTMEQGVPVNAAATTLVCESTPSSRAKAALNGGTDTGARRLACAARGPRAGRGFFGSLRALGRTRRSAVAMEMAAVALPFCLLLLGTFEVAFDLYVQSAMNLAMSEAARKVWVGKVQGPMTSSTFVTQAVCPEIGSLLNCNSIIANVHPISQQSDFWNSTAPAYTDGTNLTVGNWTVCTGGPGQFVLMQMVYAGPTFVGLLAPAFTLQYLGVTIHATYTSTAIVNQAFTASQTCNS